MKDMTMTAVSITTPDLGQERKLDIRPVYLTRGEAARHLNVPPRWLANNTRRGPRYIKIGGHVRYSLKALDAFMAAHEGRGA